MLTVKTATQEFWKNDVEGYIFFMNENLNNVSNLATLSVIEQTYYPHIKELLKKHKFEGKKDQSYVLTAMRNDKLVDFIFIGLGNFSKAWNIELENLRRAVGRAMCIIKRNALGSALMALPDEKPYNISKEELLKQITITAYMADYEYAEFKNAKDRKEWNGTLLIEIPKDDKLTQAHEYGDIIGKAINDARYWCDSPANVMTPTRLSQEAEKIARQQKLKCTIFGDERALELGMGSYMAVEKGSDQRGKFVILEYQTKTKNAPTIALLGKGVMFDTGGISLKPSGNMTGMKYDMSGAAAVIATMNIIGHLHPHINVVGITPLVENMPSGKASRQDDIVVAMNGKSIEILSTDAEGRLILADALCYAEKFYKPELIIDVATLTGACLVALGYFYTGLMTQDEQLLEVLPQIGKLTGDRVWPLPLDDDYKAANKSLVADLANSGSSAYKAGTITAACFLKEFVEKARWAHLDIAGTADGVPDINYLGKTSAGAGIRLLTEFVMNYKKYIS